MGGGGVMPFLGGQGEPCRLARCPFQILPEVTDMATFLLPHSPADDFEALFPYSHIWALDGQRVLHTD